MVRIIIMDWFKENIDFNVTLKCKMQVSKYTFDIETIEIILSPDLINSELIINELLYEKIEFSLSEIELLLKIINIDIIISNIIRYL